MISLHRYREEELLYLKLISAVTEDILSRGHFSDRFASVLLFYDSYNKKNAHLSLCPSQGS